MKRFKRIIRLIALVCIMLIAATGIGGPMIFVRREKYQDREDTIEQVDIVEEESEEEEQEQRS